MKKRFLAILALSGLGFYCLTAMATINQTVSVYNNTSSTIFIQTAYLGVDIINNQKVWDCSGDPNSGSATSCVAIAPGQAHIPPKASQVFTLSTSVKTLSGKAFLEGGVGFDILNDINTYNEVIVPIEVNPYAVSLSNRSGPDSMHEMLQLGASNLSNQVVNSPFISSVEFLSTPDIPCEATIIINDNPLAQSKS